MWDDFISGQIRRTSRNLFLMGGAILIILGLLLAAGWRDTYNFIFGPFPIQFGAGFHLESGFAQELFREGARREIVRNRDARSGCERP
jgi:hypothetical protein